MSIFCSCSGKLFVVSILRVFSVLAKIKTCTVSQVSLVIVLITDRSGDIFCRSSVSSIVLVSQFVGIQLEKIKYANN